MSSQTAASSEPPRLSRQEDCDLVKACLEGEQDAWAALIEKYKRLIYSVPVRYGLSPDDAADVFQAVCVDLYSELGNLREIQALRGWLIQVAVHKCLRWKQRYKREQPEDLNAPGRVLDLISEEPRWLEEVERDQMIREALGRLRPRCQEMIRLLFFQDPPVPYESLARQLGLATGSIGFIRGRCLKNLRKALEEIGW